MQTINSRLNTFFKYSLVASAISLAGCGVELQENEQAEVVALTAEESRAALAERRAQSLFDAHEFYSFPSNGQADVAVNTSVLLSFSHPLDRFVAHEFALTDSDGTVIDVTSVEVTEGSFATDSNNPQANGLAFKPAQALKAGELYTVTYAVGLINEADGDNELTAERTAQDPLTFTTRLAKDSANFALDANGFFPSDDLPFTTFTTLRLRMTNDVDTKTLIAGDTFKFQKVGTSEQISGYLIAKGRYVTFDPAVDLDVNASYELIVSDGVKDMAGNRFAGLEKTFTVLDSGDHAFKPMNVTMNDNNQASPYSGELTNAVTIKSVLIGGNDTTYVDSDLVTELANLGSFDDAAPLVIRKGSILNSSSLTVKVGGEFPTGFDTGNIRMTNISDATGYLINNNSSDHKYAPKQLHLFMDVAMTTDGYDEDGKLNGKANGGLSQNIMHLELMGTVRTEGAKMIIDAVSEIDVKILGVDNAHAQVSFHMESYTADETPDAAVDVQSSQFQSAYPAENITHFSLGDNVTVTYNEPLELSSLQNLVLKDENGDAVETFISQDGSSIVIDPIASLSSATEYTITGSIKDLAGNPAYVQQTFTTPYKAQALRQTSPMVEGTVPGYTCALVDANYANDIAGRCDGGLADDDKFNIFSLQADRDIFIAFSQPIDKASLVLGDSCDAGSFRVEIVNSAGVCQSTVPGVMKYDNKILTFSPTNNWQDQGDNVYQYSLISQENATKEGVDCTNGSAICSDAGYALQTTLLKESSAEDQGGPDIRIPFRAAPVDKFVFNPLMMPTTDSNRDYRWNEGQETLTSNYAKLRVKEGSFGGLLTAAQTGCAIGSSCDENYSKTFISAFMPTEVGKYDAINNRIPVTIHAQQMISSDVYVQAKLIGIIDSDTPTGTMIMRPRYPIVDGKTVVPTGYIIWNEDTEQLNFIIELDVYMDSPNMHVTLDLSHNLHSYPITMDLQGPIEFLDDGRMEISLSNKNNIDIDVSIGGGSATMTLELVPGAVSLRQISLPMK
ncbi:Ig-like domain-containing protein [Moritella dasanensis]|uniref:Ig-like domain-containing protein n=1 Tax=Moritella dasanensis TaxID=428031 RepID=UPI0002DEAFF2|nr:Ig-like domain-containing protein [Moritella dasanensis]